MHFNSLNVYLFLICRFCPRNALEKNLMCAVVVNITVKSYIFTSLCQSKKYEPKIKIIITYYIVKPQILEILFYSWYNYILRYLYLYVILMDYYKFYSR